MRGWSLDVFCVSLPPLHITRQIAEIRVMPGHPFPSSQEPAHQSAAAYAVRPDHATPAMSLGSWEYLGSHSMISGDLQPSERSRATAEDRARIATTRGFIGSQHDVKKGPYCWLTPVRQDRDGVPSAVLAF